MLGCFEDNSISKVYRAVNSVIAVPPHGVQHSLDPVATCLGKSLVSQHTPGSPQRHRSSIQLHLPTCNSLDRDSQPLCFAYTLALFVVSLSPSFLCEIRCNTPFLRSMIIISAYRTLFSFWVSSYLPIHLRSSHQPLARCLALNSQLVNVC